MSTLATTMVRKTVPRKKRTHMGRHDPVYTKHRKEKGQFKRKKNHWSQI